VCFIIHRKVFVLIWKNAFTLGDYWSRDPRQKYAGMTPNWSFFAMLRQFEEEEMQEIVLGENGKAYNKKSGQKSAFSLYR
jgi:hypothetical protein